MPLVKQKGFNFCFDPGACCECRGHCCRGSSGHVWIGHQDVERISGFLETSMVDFMERFTVRTDNRLSLKERYIRGGFACIFFDSSRNICSIYPIRPEQCRRFPFWDYFRDHHEELVRECPGIRECPSE